MEATSNDKSGTWLWTALGTAILVGAAVYGVKKIMENHPQVKDSLDDLFGKCEDVVADLESRIGISQLAS